ncbi:MAG: inositol polyphosphate kinase family protein [Oligoflexales bacterium]
MSKKYQAIFLLFSLHIFEFQNLFAGNMEINRRSLKNYLSELGIDQKQLPICEFQTKNLCQNKGAGGHSATIFSTKGGYCAKKIHSFYTVKEIEFYLLARDYCQINGGRNNICKFFPGYAGLCRYNRQIYLQMQNLKEFSEKEKNTGGLVDAWALDLKIGKKTASLSSMKRSKTDIFQQFFWISLHYFQDHYFTSSERVGFRFAGLSSGIDSPIGAYRFFGKVGYFQNPRKIIEGFLDGDKFPSIAQCFADKLKYLYFALQDEDMVKFQLIGSSLLLVYDHNSIKASPAACSVHMIDFANSFMIKDDEKDILDSNLKHVIGYRKGVENLLIEFSDYFSLLEKTYQRKK